MRADLFQAVALGCHGNIFLASGAEKGPELMPNNVAFKGIAQITFDRGGTGLNKGRIAEKIAPWFNRLARENATKFLLLTDDLTMDLRAPSRGWGLLSDGDVGMEIWNPEWQPRVMNLGEPKACRIAFTSTRATRFFLRPPLNLENDLNNIQRELIQIVQEITPLYQAHADLIQAALTGFQIGNTDADGVEQLFPREMNRAAFQVGVLGIKAVKIVTNPDWNGVRARQALGAKLPTLTQKLWKTGLLALTTSVNYSAVDVARLAA